MSSGRLVSVLTGAILSATGGAIVIASFVVPLSRPIATVEVSAHVALTLLAHDERAAPLARALPRVRDDSPVEIMPLVAPEEPAEVAPAAPTTLAAEGRMLALMNASRVQAGLVPLVADLNVIAAARAHSAVEAQYRYVYHDGPDGTARSRDAIACGTGWYGENTGRVWQENVDPQFRRVGVGAVPGLDALYMTMVFCR